MIRSLTLRIKKYLQSDMALLLLASAVSFSASTAHAEPAQEPLFLTTAATPVVMFAMSRDHELFKKAYNDYTNMDGGVMSMRDTTYNNDFSYYGYFDSGWCYTYANKKFSPSNSTSNHQCSGEWSGNFLNWATMTRIDILRQVLYGGKRQTDTDSSTVLERSYLPKDNHAFAKVYDPRTKDNTSGAVSNYVPAAFSHDSITLCNVSSGNGGEPEIRVAKGQWYNWANTEVQQCQWDVEATNPNYDSSNISELGTLVARVEVCVAEKDATKASRCKTYDSGAVKPIGVLQEYEGTVSFGLVTGTWGKNRSGGVLRKKAMPLVGNPYTGNTDGVNEYDTNTGMFNANVTGIIGNIDRFEIVGYNFSNSNYNGNHQDWGNPIGEIYAETLRYLSGNRPDTDGLSSDGPTSDFNNDGSGPSGITKIDQWDDPLAGAEDCTRCSVILISSGPNSWDADDITSSMVGSIVSGVTSDSLNTDYTDKIGTLEFGDEPSFFNGGTDRATQCSPATTPLSSVRGLCPEEPMAQGSYVVAGLAYMAKTNSIRTGEADRTVDTFAIELSQGLPSLDIPVGNSTMSIVPICTSQDHGQTCSLVSVRVEDIQSDANGNPVRGSYLFYWEDQDQGSDHDMDSVQRIEFCVGKHCQDFGTGTGDDAGSTHRGSDKTYRMHDQKITHNAVADNQLRIINSIPYWATGAQMGLTYIVSGSSTDGLQASEWVKRGGNDAHNLVDSMGTNVASSLGSWIWYNTMPPEGSDYLPPDDGDVRVYLKTRTFALGSSTTNRLRSPLFYAAKYGNFDSQSTDGAPIGWDKTNNNTDSEVPDGIPDAYFSVNNPALLEKRIRSMLGDAVGGDASATAVATNSTRLTEGSKIYQAMFNSEHWYGRLSIREIDDKNNLAKASVSTESTESGAVTTFPEPANRKIFTRTRASDGSAWTQTQFLWANLNATQCNLLNSGSELGEARVNWLRGDSANEGALLRSRDFQIAVGQTRRHIMGDVVNSSPVISGRKNARYQRLAGDAGPAYKDYDAPELLFVGANDGKLHAFNPDTLAEVFAYVPNAIYHKLAAVTRPEYGQGNQGHQYLVDGPLYVGDVYKNGNWRTILVGTFGAGARGFYALDVTGGTEPTVLFELTEEDYPQLGYMLGQPQIVPLVNGSWAIVAGNGYHYEGSTTSQLVVVNLANNAVSFIDAGAGRGLSEPALLPNFSGLVQYAYAGDREGNLWKFDITGNSSTKLFEARDDSHVAQPITSMPTLGLNPLKNDAVMIYFGTGKYFDIGDNVPAASPVQSFYALVDSGTLIGYSAGGRGSVLHEKTISQSGKKRTINGERVTEDGIESSAVDWTDIRGWYLDFDQGDQDTSERVITKPQLLFDRLIFTTLIPSGDPCAVGGHSWLMELVAIGNKNIAHRILDESVINSMREDAVVNDSGVGMGADNVWVIPCDVKGECDLLDGELPPGARGRMSWKQMD